jgi:hypothetical protein
MAETSPKARIRPQTRIERVHALAQSAQQRMSELRPLLEGQAPSDPLPLLRELVELIAGLGLAVDLLADECASITYVCNDRNGGR